MLQICFEPTTMLLQREEKADIVSAVLYKAVVVTFRLEDLHGRRWCLIMKQEWTEPSNKSSPVPV